MPYVERELELAAATSESLGRTVIGQRVIGASLEHVGRCSGGSRQGT